MVKFKLAFSISAIFFIIIYVIGSLISESLLSGSGGWIIAKYTPIIAIVLFFALFIYHNRDDKYFNFRKNIGLLSLILIPFFIYLLLAQTQLFTNLRGTIVEGIGGYIGLFFTLIVIPILFTHVLKNLKSGNSSWIWQAILIPIIEGFGIRMIYKADDTFFYFIYPLIYLSVLVFLISFITILILVLTYRRKK